MTTSDDGRGGSVPPRPRAGKPQQWFVLRPWLYDVTAAAVAPGEPPPESSAKEYRDDCP